MDIAKMTEVIKAFTALVTALSWPLLVLFIAVYFGKPLKKFLSDIGEFSGKVGTSGLEVTAKRQIEAAAALGAAAAKTTETEAAQQPAVEEQRARDIAAVVREAVRPRTIRQLSWPPVSFLAWCGGPGTYRWLTHWGLRLPMDRTGCRFFSPSSHS